jgi:hypothetical protein
VAMLLPCGARRLPLRHGCGLQAAPPTLLLV